MSGSDEERDRHEGEEHRDERHPPPSTAHSLGGGGRNPKLCSVRWPAGDTA